MKKIFSKPLIVLMLAMYCIANFATFASASVCIAKDHIGLNFFGIDSCCIERHQFTIIDNKQVSLTSDDCSDQSLSSDCNELLPDNDVPLYNSELSTAVISTIFYKSEYIDFNKISFVDKKARAPAVNRHIDNLKTVRLTI